MWVLLFFAVAFATAKNEITYSSFRGCTDSSGWIELHVQNCDTLQDVLRYTELKNILYETEIPTSYFPDRSVCLVATNTLRIDTKDILFWNAQNKAYLLLVFQGKNGKELFHIMTISNTKANIPMIYVTTTTTTMIETSSPTAAPTAPPTAQPTAAPTEMPTTDAPTVAVAPLGPQEEAPTTTAEPTQLLTDAPTMAPTEEPITTIIEEPSTFSPTEGDMDQKHDVTKANVASISTTTPSHSIMDHSRVASILLGAFGILVVVLVLLITLRKPSDALKKHDSVDDYGFEILGDSVVVDTKKEDQAILRSLGKGASEAFDANL